jgi:hypothetical protein
VVERDESRREVALNQRRREPAVPHARTHRARAWPPQAASG